MEDRYLRILEGNELFANMDDDGRTHLLACFNPAIRQYGKGDYIAREGELFTGIGVVLEGSVILTEESVVGNQRILDRVEVGRQFGEMFAYSDSLEWRINVLAAIPTTVLFLNPKSIMKMCSKNCAWHRQLQLNLLGVLSRKAMHLKYKLDIVSCKSMREKIVKFLLQQHKLSNKEMFNIPYNRQELADFLQVSRPSLSRELARMKDEKLIDYYKNTFKLLDMRGIESILL